MYIKNISGPKTDPRGTPQFKILTFNRISSIDAKDFLLDG